jgi:hypothetical protein
MKYKILIFIKKQKKTYKLETIFAFQLLGIKTLKFLPFIK